MSEDRGSGSTEPRRGQSVLVPAGGARGPGAIRVAGGSVPDGKKRRHGAGTRQRGGVRVSVILPGLPQLLAGRWGVGGAALLAWISALSVLTARWERVQGAFAGPPDHVAALVTLAMVLVLAWSWSFVDVRREAEGPTPGKPASGMRALVGAFGRNRLATVGAGVVAVLYLVALLTPLLAPADPVAQGDLLAERLLGPSGRHFLGTDQFARDVLSRLLYGARISLFIGLLAVSIAVSIGTVVGAISGFVGGIVDSLVMRVVDVFIAFPGLVLLIVVVALFEPSFWVIVLVLGLTQWPQMARIVRGEVLAMREREFILAGRALGFSRTRLIVRHVTPNILAPVIVVATLGIGDTIVLEAILSFLGLGVQSPIPSWGAMVADGRSHLMDAWWLSTLPGLAIVVTVLAFNLAGDGLRDALDPRLGQ